MKPNKSIFDVKKKVGKGGLMSSQCVMRSQIFMSIIILFLSLTKGASELLLDVVAHFIIIVNCLDFNPRL